MLNESDIEILVEKEVLEFGTDLKGRKCSFKRPILKDVPKLSFDENIKKFVESEETHKILGIKPEFRTYFFVDTETDLKLEKGIEEGIESLKKLLLVEIEKELEREILLSDSKLESLNNLSKQYKTLLKGTEVSPNSYEIFKHNIDIYINYDFQTNEFCGFHLDLLS